LIRMVLHTGSKPAVPIQPPLKHSVFGGHGSKPMFNLNLTSRAIADSAGSVTYR
jgi:hypothetical protein